MSKHGEKAQTAYFTAGGGPLILNVLLPAGVQRFEIDVDTMKRLVAEGAHRIWNEGKDHG